MAVFEPAARASPLIAPASFKRAPKLANDASGGVVFMVLPSGGANCRLDLGLPLLSHFETVGTRRRTRDPG
jgi:hypothetical protein